jgi:hypothetical protein
MIEPKEPMPSLFIVNVLCLSALSLSAQWLSYRTPGVPRTDDGRVDLAAPTPKAIDGKPDLSGVWESAPQYLYTPCAATDSQIVGQHAQLQAHFVGPEPMTRQPWVVL